MMGNAEWHVMITLILPLQARVVQKGIGAFIDKRPPVWCDTQEKTH
jgi:hypothetical protein